MKLELISIVSNNGAALDFENDLTFENTEFLGTEYKFNGPLHVVGKIDNISGSLLLTAKVNAVVCTECARCKTPVEFEMNYDISENITVDDTDIEDAIVLEGTLLDLDEAVLKNFYVNVPSRVLCKTDCQGLCQYCGANKNNGDCGCEDEYIDPRFSVIDDLFKD